MRIVYIHGANASPRSFNFIQRHLPQHEHINVTYDVSTPLTENIKNIRNEIQEKIKNNEFHVIGHSLGGVISVGLHHEFDNLNKTFTMSAPFGGSKFIEYLRWICPGYRLFADLKTSSPIIKAVQKTKITKPIMSIVTSGGGNPLFGEPNDGTVSVSSQISLKGPKYIEYSDLHHFEVLLSDRIVEHINDFIFKD